MVFRDFCPFLGTPPGGPKNEKNTHLGVIFLISGPGFGKIRVRWVGPGTRSWEGLTARGGLDGPHLGHPLRRDQVRGSACT
jgi:hypothetical protein